MGSINGIGNNKYALNHSMPAANDARLGDCIDDLLTQLNLLSAQYQLLLAHLDTANVAGIGNANAATYGANNQLTPLADRVSSPD